MSEPTGQRDRGFPGGGRRMPEGFARRRYDATFSDHWGRFHGYL